MTHFAPYAKADHTICLKKLYKNLGKEISPLGLTIANILGYVGGGLYNCPFDIEKIDWSNSFCIKIPWDHHLCNFDDASLSRLWVLCHRKMIRVTISAIEKELNGDECEEQMIPYRPVLELMFHQRTQREGSVMSRLPDCETMIREIDEDFLRVPP